VFRLFFCKDTVGKLFCKSSVLLHVALSLALAFAVFVNTDKEEKLKGFTSLWPNSDLAVKLDNGISCGTGWPILCEHTPFGYRILLITAAHVVEDDPDIPEWVLEQYQKPWQASFRDGTLENGRVLSQHPQRDVAVLQFYSKFSMGTHVMAEYEPEYGETVVHSGYPACDEDLRTTLGLSCHAGVATFSAYPGHSGGPVLNGNGEVIGILVGGLGNGFDMIDFSSRYIPTNAFIEWVEIVLAN